MPIKLLVVDDDVDFSEELVEALGQLTYEIAAVQNPRDALEVIKSDKNAKWIALIDVRMPVIDGFTLANILIDWSKIDLNVKIIFLTGNVTTDIALRAVRVQAFDVLSKPIASDRLLETVDRAAATFFKEEQLSAARSVQIPSAELINLHSDLGFHIQKAVEIVMAEKDLRLSLPAELHEEDCWSMFLEIFKVGLSGELLPAANLYYTPKLTTSTALRRIASLIEAGLVAKFSDASDGRRVLLGLTEEGKNLLTNYFAQLKRIGILN